MKKTNMMPCKDCPRKGCGSYHDKCSKYTEYKQKMQEISDKKNTGVEIEGYMADRRRRK